MLMEEYRRKYEWEQIYVSGSFPGTLKGQGKGAGFFWMGNSSTSKFCPLCFPVLRERKKKHEALNETATSLYYLDTHLSICMGWTGWFLEALSSPWF